MSAALFKQKIRKADASANAEQQRIGIGSPGVGRDDAHMGQSVLQRTRFSAARAELAVSGNHHTASACHIDGMI